MVVARLQTLHTLLFAKTVDTHCVLHNSESLLPGPSACYSNNQHCPFELLTYLTLGNHQVYSSLSTLSPSCIMETLHKNPDTAYLDTVHEYRSESAVY